MRMREDPWEFEHGESRAQRHQRDWVQHVRDEELVTTDWVPPTMVIVCPQCGGRGTSSLYLGSFSMEQMSEDPDFMEDYFHGQYDRTCESCHGQNVVHQIDEERLTPELQQNYKEWMDDAYESDSIQRQEWMMGA